MRVLAISGSLRAASINTALLRAAARVSPADISVQVYASIGALPLFNPDLESLVPEAVARLRDAVASADALIVEERLIRQEFAVTRDHHAWLAVFGHGDGNGKRLLA